MSKRIYDYRKSTLRRRIKGVARGQFTRHFRGKSNEKNSKIFEFTLKYIYK